MAGQPQVGPPDATPLAAKAASVHRISAGDVIHRTFSTFGRAWVPLLGTAWLLGAPGVVLALAGADSRQGPSLNAAIGILQSGAIAAGMATALRGERPRMGAILTSAATRFWTLFAQAVGAGLLTLLGLALLVVPGVILWSGFFVSTPLVIEERALTGSEALRRSWELTRGNRRPLFAVGLVFMLLVAACWLAVIFALDAILGEGSRVGAALADVLVTPAYALYFAAPAVAHRALRGDAELDARRLEAVFE